MHDSDTSEDMSVEGSIDWTSIGGSGGGGGSQEEEEDPHKHEPPNELLVTLVRAKNLAVMDQAMIPGTGGKAGGSSDPVVTLRVMPGGHTMTSTTKMKNLTPVWRERFELAAPDVGGTALELVVDDYDHAR